jgi:hypothetical protein
MQYACQKGLDVEEMSQPLVFQGYFMQDIFFRPTGIPGKSTRFCTKIFHSTAANKQVANITE